MTKQVVLLASIALGIPFILIGTMTLPATLHCERDGHRIDYDSKDLPPLSRIKGQIYYWARWCGIEENRVRFLSNADNPELWFEDWYDDIGIRSPHRLRARLPVGDYSVGSPPPHVPPNPEWSSEVIEAMQEYQRSLQGEMP